MSICGRFTPPPVWRNGLWYPPLTIYYKIMKNICKTRFRINNQALVWIIKTNGFSCRMDWDFEFYDFSFNWKNDFDFQHWNELRTYSFKITPGTTVRLSVCHKNLPKSKSLTYNFQFGLGLRLRLDNFAIYRERRGLDKRFWISNFAIYRERGWGSRPKV